MLIENSVDIIQKKLFDGFRTNVIGWEFYFYSSHNLFYFMADTIFSKIKNKWFKIMIGQEIMSIMHFSII